MIQVRGVLLLFCLIDRRKSEVLVCLLIPVHLLCGVQVNNKMLGAGFQLTQLQRAQSDGGRSFYTKERDNDSAFHKLHVSEASSSNVQRFLESVTPAVPAHFLSKVCFNMSSLKIQTFISLFI